MERTEGWQHGLVTDLESLSAAREALSVAIVWNVEAAVAAGECFSTYMKMVLTLLTMSWNCRCYGNSRLNLEAES